MVEDALHDLASPLTRLTTPGGSPSVKHLERDLLRERHLLRGLQDERVTAADRKREEPERHHRGEVDGTIAAHTPTGWRIVSASIPRDTSSSTRPCIVVGSARRLDHLDHARHLGPRVGDRLAHLGGHRPRQLLAALVQALPQRKQMTGPPRSPTRHARPAAPSAASTAASRSFAVDSGTRASTSPEAGFVTSSASAPDAGVQPPSDVIVEQANGGGGFHTSLPEVARVSLARPQADAPLNGPVIS